MGLNNFFNILSIIILLCLIAGCAILTETSQIPESARVSPTEIQWSKSFSEASELARKDNKPLMLVFPGVSSKRLDERIFSVPEVVELSQRFVTLKIGTNQTSLIDRFRVQEFPTIVFSDWQGGEYDRIVGYKSWQSYVSGMKNALIPVEVEYSVQIGVPKPDSAIVECIFRNIRQKTLILAFRERHDKIGDISYETTVGISGLEEMEKGVWIMRFNSEGMKTIKIKYEVGLNVISRVGYQPEYASYIDKDFGVLDGRILFIEPYEVYTTSKVKIHLNLPSGWRAITPWDTTDNPGLFLTDSIEEATDSVFGIGQFQFVSRFIGEHEIMAIYCGKDDRSQYLESRANEMVLIFNDYIARFGDFPYKRYLAVFTDRTPDGKYITGSSAHVVGFAGSIRVDQSFVAHEIFHIWNAGIIKQKSYYEGWFKEGFTQYYGYLTPYRIGLYSKERFLQYLKSDYEAYIQRYEAGNDIPLSRVREETARKEGHLRLDVSKLHTMYHKGALVAAIIDEEIKKRTNNLKTLDDVMKYMFQNFTNKRYSTEDILESVNIVSGQDFSKFFFDFVYGTTKLPNISGGL